MQKFKQRKTANMNMFHGMKGGRITAYKSKAGTPFQKDKFQNLSGKIMGRSKSSAVIHSNYKGHN
jgi:hypothetical protein